MRKPTVLLVVALVLGLGWGVYVASQPTENSGVALTPQVSPLASSTLAVPSPSAAASVSRTTLPDVMTSGSAGVGSSQAEQANALRMQINALGLTRELSGAQAVSYDGRSRTVLGTKETTNSQSTQTVLLVRDDTSGQIDYWQPALKIVLKPGNDYEAFIRERPGLQRRFVNIEHAQVAVDAANIASEHAALSADARVASVSLMPVAVLPTSK